MRVARRILLALLIVSLAAAGARAQTPRAPAQPQPPPNRPFVERGFVSLNLGGQFSPGELSDRVTFEANAETGTLDADYSGRSALVFDGGSGLLVYRQIGVGFGVSHSGRSGSAFVRAQVPHPFFDDRHRAVEGDASDISRRETAVHAQVYYEFRHRGPWRVRLFGGPSYVRVEQELVTGVETQETFPFDTAAFARATTERAKGSAFGGHAGLDISRMMSRRLGLGASLRYTGVSIGLNVPGGRDVSTDGGGLTAGLGLRVAF
jgi:hypothetical protein